MARCSGWLPKQCVEAIDKNQTRRPAREVIVYKEHVEAPAKTNLVLSGFKVLFVVSDLIGRKPSDSKRELSN